MSMVLESNLAPVSAPVAPTGSGARDQFYADLTKRNKGLITSAEQASIRRTRVLVAGCGSIGGSVVEQLVRVGFERLVLAEPDEFDVHNLNRQAARLVDIGVNKGVAIKRQMHDISPNVDIQVATSGITDANVVGLVVGADMIFDGVDVTSPVPLVIKRKLHATAKRHGVPVISGYDIGGVQLLVIYRYDNPRTKLFHGRIDASFAAPSPFAFLYKLIPLKYLPLEIFPILDQLLAGKLNGFPQVVYTAKMYGSMATRAALDILAGLPTQRYVAVDLNDLSRPLTARIKARIRRFAGMIRFAMKFNKSRHQLPSQV